MNTAKLVTRGEEAEWVRRLIPLPHEVAISRTVALAAAKVEVRTPPEAGPMVKQAVRGLRDLIQPRTGSAPTGKAFEILVGRLTEQGVVLGVSVAGADRLHTLPNSPQAYLIRPVGERRLVVAGRDERGVFYGVQTLIQLLQVHAQSDALRIPLAVVTDWPDLDERGVWNVGYSTPGFIPWLASLKLNFTHINVVPIFERGRPTRCPQLPMDLIRQARDRAFNLMPHLAHYDYWPRHGLEKVCPQLLGKGDSALNPRFRRNPTSDRFRNCRCPCASNPLLKQVLTDWILSAAAQGVRDFSLWLTEYTPCQCGCETCVAEGPMQFQRETRASVAAIHAAREKYPDLAGRIFFCLGNTPKDVQDSEECLALVAPDIRVEKVYGRNEAFDHAARRRWVANYSGPSLAPGLPIRYAFAREMHEYARGYREAGYSALYSIGYLYAPDEVKGHWERAFGDFNYSALAEWTWNAKGRSPREFAIAWAARQGWSSPERFADWAEIMEHAGRHVLPRPVRFRLDAWLRAAQTLGRDDPTNDWLTGRRKPKDDLDHLIAQCDRALSIAQTLGKATVVLETRCIGLFLVATRLLLALHKDLAGKDAEHIGKAERERLRATAAAFDAAVEELMRVIEATLELPRENPEHGSKVVKDTFREWALALRRNLANAVAFARNEPGKPR